ncbi:MAG: alpha/beta hydrolase [Salinisphaera sp.]|jgi:pimeloyl-ACP methyl ester carboxylesterase|nr:alpha/beta hydrolase [Salinisphaera sp.]
MTCYLDAVQHMSLRGLEHAWREFGPRDAPALVLLHGLMDNGASFAPLVDALAERLRTPRRILAPDWRGHGATGWAPGGQYWFPEYLADLDALLGQWVGDEPVTLIGHSMGGQIASLFAGTRRERVCRLIALDSLNVPDADRGKTPDRYARWLQAQTHPPQLRIYDDLEAIAARIAHRYPELTLDLRNFLAEHWSTPVDGGPRRRMRVDPWHRISFPYGFRADEAMSIWRRVSAPVLCIDGGASRAAWFTPESQMHQRRACFMQLRRVVVPGSGHMLHLQTPQDVADHIVGFIE